MGRDATSDYSLTYTLTPSTPSVAPAEEGGRGGKVARYALTLRRRSRGLEAFYWRSVRTMSTDKDDLEPLDPEMGAELFLEHKATDCTDSTVQNHRYRLKHFL